MLSENFTSKCSEPSVRNEFVATYSIFCFLYGVLLALSIFSLIQAKRRGFHFTTDMKISRYFLVFMFFIKTVVQLINAVTRMTKMPKHLTFFLTTFPGYIVDIMFCLLLFTWCNLFLSFCSSRLYCILKSFKLISFLTIPLSIIVFIITFFITISDSTSEQTSRATRSFENYYALITNIFIAIVFIVFICIMIFSMDVKFTLKDFTHEQIVLWLCIASCFGLLVRAAARIYFQVQISRLSPLMFICSTGQFVSLILRETFGQVIPFFFILLSDLCIQKNDVSINLDQSDLLMQ